MVITLLSDFGAQDFTPGIAKGILIHKLPDAKIVDISHEIAPLHLLQCCYFLKSSYSHFPENTIHISFFNVFGENPRQTLLTKVDNQFIISSDNGLLPLTFSHNLQKVYEIPINAKTFADWLHELTLFLAQWQKQNFELNNLKETTAAEHPFPFEPYCDENSIACQIIHVDRFGNVVLNLQKDFFENQRKGRSFNINFSRNNVIKHLSNHYTEVPEGEKLCRFNLGGFMEIAVNNGSAAQLFGLTLMRDQQLIYQKVKISFT